VLRRRVRRFGCLYKPPLECAPLTIAFVPRYRIIDLAGSELGIVEDPREQIDMGEQVALPEGGSAEVVEVYDDEEHGREGGVNATLVADTE
jgi:hypothetical protein